MSGLENRSEQYLDKISNIVGLVPGEVLTGGPMGSARWSFTSEVVLLELYSDRGRFGVGAGPVGGLTFGPEIWAEALAVEQPDASVDAHIDFFGRHLAAIGDFLHNHDAVSELRSINRIHVKAALGMGPGTGRPTLHGGEE